MNDPFVGSLTFCRIYSGKVESGDYLLEHGEGQVKSASAVSC